MTIDDGPDNNSGSDKEENKTKIILDILQQHQAKATFFLISDRIPGNEQLITRMVEEGHELGNHLTEDELAVKLKPKEFDRKVTEAQHILSSYLTNSEQLKWFRPGGGWCGHKQVDFLKEKYQYDVALGSIWPYDTHIISSQFASWFILANAYPGAIIVLHDVGERGETTIASLTQILPQLRDKGYEFVTLSELKARSSPPQFNPMTIIVQGLKRLIAATNNFPTVNGWVFIFLIIWLPHSLLLIILGYNSRLIKFQLAKPPERKQPRITRFYLQLVGRIFFLPAIIEELAFRALFLPSAEEMSLPTTNLSGIIWSSLIGLIIYVYYHIPFGRLIDIRLGKQNLESNYLNTFKQPIFLVLTSILGSCCTLTYIYCGSIWLSIIFHWLVVVVWIVFLGGYRKLQL